MIASLEHRIVHRRLLDVFLPAAIATNHSVRHGRARPGHPRLFDLAAFQDVDARDKRGHDEALVRPDGIAYPQLLASIRD
jgi:hypothetical protein